MQINNDWEKKLANQVNRTTERTTTAVAAGNKNEIKRKELTSDFLDSIGILLQESIARFNESAKTKIEFIKRATDRRQNEYCGLKFQTRQILFTNTNRGFIRIDLAENEAIQEAAFVLARLSRSGDFITWEEKNLLGVGNRLEPVTLKHLVRKYITFLVTT